MLQSLWALHSQAKNKLQTVQQIESEFSPMEQMGNRWLNLAATSHCMTAGVALAGISDGF